MKCYICGSESIFKKTILFNYPLYRCNNCTVEFFNPLELKDLISKIYNDSYYTPWGMNNEDNFKLIKQMKQATFKLQVDTIRKYKQTGVVLDVGCAMGFFLETAREYGFDPYGVELCEYSANIAKKSLGNEKIYQGRLESCVFPLKYFDIITMTDFLEHVPDPCNSIIKAKELLKDDGIISVMLPNTGSFSKKVMGKTWPNYKLEHLFYFNKVSLCYLAETAGLKILEIKKSKKVLNFYYINHQFVTYRHSIITPLISIFNLIIPAWLKHKNFALPFGEISVIFSKK